MVAVSVSGHGTVFKVPTHPQHMKQGDICELDPYLLTEGGYQVDGYWMVTAVRLLEQPGMFRVTFQPVLGSPTRYGSVGWTLSHNDVVLVMK